MNDSGNIAAFLTGQSDPLSNALSPVQRDFFEACGLGQDDALRWNFPYDPLMDVHREVPLWRASWNNSRQYLQSRRPDFGERYRARMVERFSPYRRVVLVVGSCGLEILANFRMPSEFREKTWVFAIGPVSRSIPECAAVRLVQGRRDLISKAWHRKVDHVVSCGHMNYLTCPEVMRLFVEFHQEATVS